MTRYFLIAFFFLFTSCLKDEQDCGEAGTTVAPENEVQRVLSYLNTNPDAAALQLENSGMYYSISQPGNTRKPGLCNVVSIKYVGKLENGNVFDQSSGTTPISFTLGGLIEGWKRALPLLGEGGKMRIYIPPALGYGAQGLINPNTGAIIIPANEIIIFDIELVSFR
jgi:FKBP-type peptidyl-prolyl cis-trans isomerase FkpA